MTELQKKKLSEFSSAMEADAVSVSVQDYGTKYVATVSYAKNDEILTEFIELDKVEISEKLNTPVLRSVDNDIVLDAVNDAVSYKIKALIGAGTTSPSFQFIDISSVDEVAENTRTEDAIYSVSAIASSEENNSDYSNTIYRPSKPTAIGVKTDDIIYQINVTRFGLVAMTDLVIEDDTGDNETYVYSGGDKEITKDMYIDPDKTYSFKVYERPKNPAEALESSAVILEV